MDGSHVQCPKCGTMLTLPPGCEGKFVRCGSCKERFRVPEEEAVEKDVASWLLDEEDLDEKAVKSFQEDLAKSLDSRPPSSSTAVLPALEGQVRLVRVEGKGTLLEFSSDRLKDTAFRCAMPRRCMQCGVRTHLQAHVIVYAPQLRDNLSLEAEHIAGDLLLTENDVKDLTHEQILQRLPRVPNVPAPADQPMPYWLCDMCSRAAVISGQIQVNSVTGRGRCRLLIKNIRYAEEFLVAIGGKDTPAHAELRKRIDATEETPWDAYSLTVQHRLEQWYRPQEGEKFIAYVPDRDRFRSEDGTGGLLISDRRLIYHTQRRHAEIPVGEHVELDMVFSGAKAKLQIKSQSCEIQHFSLDRDGSQLLRRGLTLAKFDVAWR